MRPIIQENRTSSKRASPRRPRGALAHLSDFGNDRSKPQKAKMFNWDHALVTSDDSSYTGQVENKTCKLAQGNTKKGNEQSYGGTTFGTHSLQIEIQASDDSNNESHAKDSHRAKNVPLALIRIAEEVDDEMVFEHSFNSPIASVNHMLSPLSPQSALSSKYGNRFSRSDDHTDLATDIAGNLTSMRAQKDNDAASLISWPASDINSNLTPRAMKGNDTMDLMSFFSEPATEIMGNLTSAGLRGNRTTDSSLDGEQFLAGVETQMDDESLFSEEERVSKPAETPKISNRVAPGSEADNSIISDRSKQTSTTAKSKGKEGPKGGKVVSRWSNQKEYSRERVSGSQNLTVPGGSDDTTEKKGTVDQSEKITTKPQSTFCVTFVVCTVLAFVAGLLCIVVALPTLMKDPKASTSPNFSGGERSKTIWNLAVSVSVSGSNSLNEMSSPVFQAYDWMMRNDSIDIEETSSEMLKERLVLAILYFATGGPKWNEKLNFLSGKNICGWNNLGEKNDLSVGVFCDIQSRVKHLFLVGNNLEGTVPIEVSQLEYLQILDLSRNVLHGDIPQEIGEMTTLIDLNFMSNGIQGNVPTALGNLGALVSLNLSSNKLTGTLPTELGNLRVLERLSVGDNKLEGTIPNSLQLMANLTEINLFRNGFHGDIPRGVAALSHLEILNLASNRFVGNFTEDFCQTGQSYDSFWADCRGSSPMVECSCCTICCERNGTHLQC